MSDVSSSTALSVYLSTIKDEPTQVAKNAASDKVLASTVSNFRSIAPTLGSSTAILANYKALTVLTGAYNMSGQIRQTAVLKDLLTQSPDSTTSLVQQTSNSNYLHFARATEARTLQTASLGTASTLSMAASGTTAASLTMQNTAWNGTSQTATRPGVSWSFVLNDGTASASIASALNAAETAAGGTADYAVGASGGVTSTPGAPPVTTSTDSAGNVTYSLALATDSTGKVIRRADIVSVSTTATSTAAANLTALSTAMNSAGFDTSVSEAGALSVIDPAAAGVNTLAQTYGTAIATATSSTIDSEGRLALGDAGINLSAGQVLTDGSNVLGTVSSVDTFGNVTLTAPSRFSPAVGDTIEVATGLRFANAGSAYAASAPTVAGGTTIAFGSSGVRLEPGQIVTSGGVTIGTIGSIDSSGNATMLSGAAIAIAQGAPLVVLPALSAGSTPGLADASNVTAIVSGFETNAYEGKMGAEYTGMDNALYYTRTMGSITSINQLMSNANLLTVVTTSLGMGSYFGSLDFDQQVRILTDKVDLKKMTSPAGIKQTAEQYLISEAANTTTTPTGLVALLSGTPQSTTDLFTLINGGTVSNTTTNSATDPILSLFA